MTSLKKHLESLSNPAPTLPDVEEGVDVDESAARVIGDEENEAGEITELQPRRIRQAIHLEDDDERYGGTAVRSSDVFDNEWEPLVVRKGKDEIMESDAESEEDEEDLEDEGEATASEDEASDAASEDAEDEEEYEDGEDGGITTIRQNDESTKRSEAVRAQFLMWDRLMHLTIKLHGTMRAFNQLPRGKIAKELLDAADESTLQQYRKLKKNAFEAAQLLFNAEQCLARRALGVNAEKNDEDDEEIESSDDEAGSNGIRDENNVDKADEEEHTAATHNARSSKTATAFHVVTFAKKLQHNDKKFDKYRNATLTKWDERTRLIGKKSSKKDFSALESAIVKQIQKILADRSRLISRTQAKRSDFDRIGGDPEASQDPEIFDDDDFHQALLKDFIEQKSAQTVDPIAMSRQWLEVQKLRQKRTKHKVVDTRASKGRKIRYVTIPKLVNFFPATPEVVPWSHEKRNELFKSLFL